MRRWPCLLLIPVTLALVVSCVVNPVTGEKEFSLVSESGELQIGQQNYAPMQQVEGGLYRIDPELQPYVASVGQKLAAVSDRPLPYEFVVLNNPVPNAWALPGGKIAVNTGLLWELNDEAELAAVLGHEIVHAAARHGARAQTRSLLLQGSLLVGAVALSGREYGDLALGAASVGALLITSAYSREQELESDLYGTRYMAKAGYDPNAAVRLQETFVRLSEGRESDVFGRLFGSHPPSQARVDKNRETAAALGGSGSVNAEAFRERTAYLRKQRPAYEDYKKGREALQKKDRALARSLAQRALTLEPREARFHGLLGDVAASDEDWAAALPHYDKAVTLDPDYYANWLNRGMARYHLGQREAARGDLETSLRQLPSSEAHLVLGQLDQRDGLTDSAIAHFRTAASANSALGKQAQAELVRLDLPRRPDQYLGLSAAVDERGQLAVIVHNRSPVAVRNVVVVVRYAGRERSGLLRGPLRAGTRAPLPLYWSGLTPKDLAAMQAQVVSAELAERGERR